MNDSNNHCTINLQTLSQYQQHLYEQEKSHPTIQSYLRSLKAFAVFLDGRSYTKETAIRWKETLTSRYAPNTVNAMLAAINGFAEFSGCPQFKVKPLKIQRELFIRPERELTRSEYGRLVNAADRSGNRRLSLVLQTICATGIRVSELRFITAEAVEKGYAQVDCKGKRRTVFLPEKLRRLIGIYMKKQKKTAGAVFITRSGRPLDRSNIWRDMKALCERAGVEPGKVFPHNLRHLFARTFYSLEKDLSRLADILGHTNVATTRIYTVESGAAHRRQMERMGLVIT